MTGVARSNSHATRTGPRVSTTSLPVIDMAPLFGANAAERSAVAAALGEACRGSGFFYVTGHGIAAELIGHLDRASPPFFALPEPEKNGRAMSLAGLAWPRPFP